MDLSAKPLLPHCRAVALLIDGENIPACLAPAALTAARRLGLAFEVEEVTELNAIIDAGVMRTPALAVDDEILVEGKVPSSDEIQTLLG